VVKDTDAIPFDAPEVELGHHDGKCSFQTIVERHGLKEKGLLRLAQVVHGSDTNDFVSDPISADLEAIAPGYSLRVPEDLEHLEHQFEACYALYAWCRLQVAKG
jgi:hypothetical protein